ncbi:ImmA/IrrE family metallo-endopeptidase [Bradyrhizobium sp. BEA-2-5]|uniref:ImmA/IrrE family metallo-endopeptidase n=1 Tax=Bradyrhizobium sp. BEA-2-5 TaxID=3080015 RepID=UPI00397BF737
MEEYWHILLGHKLTRIAQVADGYGRTYDQAEEHDAFYLASATLLPRAAIVEALSRRMASADIGLTFGTLQRTRRLPHQEIGTMARAHRQESWAVF